MQWDICIFEVRHVLGSVAEQGMRDKSVMSTKQCLSPLLWRQAIYNKPVYIYLLSMLDLVLMMVTVPLCSYDLVLITVKGFPGKIAAHAQRIDW